MDEVENSYLNIRVYDYSEYATWGIEPGFYWTLAIDENGESVDSGKELDIVGPFETSELAAAAGAEFIRDAIQGLFNSVTNDREAA